MVLTHPHASIGAMAAQIAGYTDTQNLDGFLFTSKYNKIPKSPAALRHTSNMSLLAITNLDKITQFEYRYAAVRKAHDALLLFMVNTPGRYTYRPALCPALRGQQKSPWLPFIGQGPTVDTQLWHKGQKPLPGRSSTSSASAVKPSVVPKAGSLSPPFIGTQPLPAFLLQWTSDALGRSTGSTKSIELSSYPYALLFASQDCVCRCETPSQSNFS